MTSPRRRLVRPLQWAWNLQWLDESQRDAHPDAILRLVWGIVALVTVEALAILAVWLGQP